VTKSDWLPFWIAMGLLLAGVPAAACAADDRIEVSRVSSAEAEIYSIESFGFDVIRVQTSEGKPGELRSADLLTIRWLDRPVEQGKATFEVLLAGGDRIYADQIEILDEQLVVKWSLPIPEPIRFPLEQVRAILRVGAVRDGIVRDEALLGAAIGAEADDTLVLKNRDRIRGELLGLSPDEASIRTELGESKVRLGELAAVVFSPDLLMKREVPESHAVVTLTDGSSLTVDSVQKQNQTADWELNLGTTKINIADGQLFGIQVYRDDARSLVDVVPKESRWTPFLPDLSPDAKDPPAAAVNETVNGRPVPQGISAIGRTELFYDLDQNVRAFAGAVAIPDSIGPEGSATFRVVVDGQIRFDSGVVRREDGVRRVPPIDLTGARSMSLIIDYGERWDILNKGTWIDPRMIRKPADRR
jgi:hypothetical protein